MRRHWFKPWLAASLEIPALSHPCLWWAIEIVLDLEIHYNHNILKTVPTGLWRPLSMIDMVRDDNIGRQYLDIGRHEIDNTE